MEVSNSSGIDINWIATVFALLLGFMFKVLYDELKSPRFKIVSISREPFPIRENEGSTDFYSAYRVRIENKQKRFLNCAAENCTAWIELESSPEAYQLCWVGNRAEVTINVGDIQDIDFCARKEVTGEIYAPTERGYFEPSPRRLGDGKSAIRARIRITSKNGKKEEKSLRINPSGDQLEIKISGKHSEEIRRVNQNSSNLNTPNIEESLTTLNKQIENNEKASWFRFLFGLGFATIAIGMGILFSSSQSTDSFSNTILVLLIFILGFLLMFKSINIYKFVNKWLANIGCIALILGALMMFIHDVLLTDFKLSPPYQLIPWGIGVGCVGFILMVFSLKMGKTKD